MDSYNSYNQKRGHVFLETQCIYIYIYSTIKTVDTEQDTELNQARSKPDTVDRSVRIAHTFVHH